MSTKEVTSFCATRRSLLSRVLFSVGLCLVLGLVASRATAQVQVTVPGNASGHFGNPADLTVPLVPALTVDGPMTIKITYLSGTVTGTGGAESGPNGVALTTTLGEQTPLQEGLGVSGGKVNNFDGLIGAFVCKWEKDAAGFKAVDGTKAAAEAGILPDRLFFVGESKTYQAKEAGTLYLGINAFQVGSNGGGYVVDVTTPSVSYDATTEFSGTKNSNGVWSYGWTNLRGEKLNLFSYVAPGGYDGLLNWSWPNPGPPQLGYNPTNAPISYATLTIPAKTLFAHPGPGDQNAVLRFTAPSAGTYSIQASFWGDDWGGPTSTNVAVLHNSSTTLFTADLDGFGRPSAKSYTGTVTLQAGDTIDLSVGYGPDGNYGYDATGLSAVITQE